MVEVKAHLNNLRMSDKKVRLVGDMIKGMEVHAALVRLQFIRKDAAYVVSKLLKSAIANAEHNNNLKKETLIVKNVIVNQGTPLKRWRPAAFGSAHGFKKHGCHVSIILGLKAGIAEPLAKTKKVERTEEMVEQEKKPTIKKESVKKAPRTATKKAPRVSKETKHT